MGPETATNERHFEKNEKRENSAPRVLFSFRNLRLSLQRMNGYQQVEPNVTNNKVQYFLVNGGENSAKDCYCRNIFLLFLVLQQGHGAKEFVGWQQRRQSYLYQFSFEETIRVSPSVSFQKSIRRDKFSFFFYLNSSDRTIPSVDSLTDTDIFSSFVKCGQQGGAKRNFSLFFRRVKQFCCLLIQKQYVQNFREKY